jgi:hypothetical protein
VTINFKKEGNTHKTVCGGLVSLLIYGIMSMLILKKLSVLVSYEEDKISRNSEAVPDE